MSAIEHHQPKELFHNPAYSQVVSATGTRTRTIYTAGQVSVDKDGRLIGEGDLGAQAAQAMRNVGVALAAAGASFTDLVKITTYVVDYRPELRSVISKARSSFFTDGPPPASTLVGVSALAMSEWLVEIEAVAVVAA